MADRIIEDADVAVDELKRKARRRLLGAIVLALAAAILIPLLLEKEPKKLGEDVAIQIPPIDDGKFVSRLNADKTKDAKSDAKSGASPGSADIAVKPDAGAAPSAAPAKTTPSAEAPATPTAPVASPSVNTAIGGEASPTPKAAAPNRIAEAAPRATKSADKASVNSATKSLDKASANSATKSANNASANSAAKAAAGSETPSASAEPSSTPDAAADTNAPSVEGFVVQLAAFTDDKGANALANRLKRTGYPAYTEPVETDRGTLWRVRVGGYPSRAAAGAARAKLKAEGHNGIVAAAK